MSKPLSLRVIELGDEATARLEIWRQNLLRLSAGGLHGVVETDPLGQELRGAAAVAALAEMERLLREFLVELSLELDRAAVPIRELTPGLRSLTAHAAFQSMTVSSKGETHWENRALVTQLDQSTQIAQFPSRSGSRGPQPPLDGKTIRAGHFERIWALLDLAGDAVPLAAMGSSLNALSTLRNEVAHANDALSEVFHEQTLGKSAADLAEHLRQCVLLVDHFCLATSAYAAARGYQMT